MMSAGDVVGLGLLGEVGRAVDEDEDSDALFGLMSGGCDVVVPGVIGEDTVDEAMKSVVGDIRLTV